VFVNAFRDDRNRRKAEADALRLSGRVNPPFTMRQ